MVFQVSPVEPKPNDVRYKHLPDFIRNKNKNLHILDNIASPLLPLFAQKIE